MADIEDRQAGFVPQTFQIGQDSVLAGLIQRREGLVHQQQAGIGQDRAAQGHPLAFAPRQGCGTALQQMPDAQHLDHAILHGAAAMREAASVKQVLPHAEMRKQPRLLKDIADTAPVGRKKSACRGIRQDGAASLDAGVVGAHQAGDGVDDAGLARSRLAEQGGNAGRGLESRIQREVRKGVADGDGQHHPPPMRRATARDRASDRNSAPMAMATAIRTSRTAAPSPPGT